VTKPACICPNEPCPSCNYGPSMAERDRKQEFLDELKDVDEGGKQLHFSFWDRTDFSLLTEAELAAVLNVKPLTLAKWRRQGEGPRYVQPGKDVFYHREHVAEWLKRISKDPVQVCRERYP
jgi:hypothetical protein